MRIDREWPATLADPQTSGGAVPPTLTMSQISRELDAIRRELIATVYQIIRPQP
jgi:hypothetical protein